MEAWGTRDGDRCEKIQKLMDTLEVMKNTAAGFSSCNLQLKGIAQRIGRLLHRASAAKDQATNPAASSSRKRKKGRSGKKSKNLVDESLPALRSLCQEVDVMIGQMVEMYCAVSPEDQSGKQIFCLCGASFMKKHLAAAPRLEIPTLLRNDATTELTSLSLNTDPLM